MDSRSRPSRSPQLFGLFRWYARRYVARHFHAVRIAKNGPIPNLPRRPVIVVLNHPSWWDPLIGLILTESLPAWRTHFAPIDSRGADPYRFLQRIGFFAIDPATPHAGLRFLRTSLSILAHPDSTLWITAQGIFADCRVRPPALRPGIGRLVHRLSGALLLPMAIEYAFWNDRCPEVLVRFAPTIAVDSGRDRSPETWTVIIEEALAAVQDDLAIDSQRRDSTRFDILLAGTAGVGGPYDAWRRLRAALRGAHFVPDHPAQAAQEISQV
jgi:1-acyl-sn-glycerol-3-phosphate acyltransferase